MKDRNVIIYGLTPGGPDVGSGSIPAAIHVSDAGDAYTILTLAGFAVEQTSPWQNGVQTDDGWRGAFVPCTSATFVVGQGFDDPVPFYSPLCRQSQMTYGIPANALIVDEMICFVSNDSPAVHTAAQVNISAGADNPLQIKTISISINAVAAITVPIRLRIIEDAAGTPTTAFQKRYTAPAGTTILDTIKFQSVFTSSVQVIIDDPGATNFCDLNVEWLGSLADAPLFPNPT